MNANPKVTADHLRRRAVIYIRQSSAVQVANNLESQRRQYGLADQARQFGFQQVEIIDEDLGRSGSGQVDPGFARLVAEVCTGSVGAVFCIEASRLARNGRDWHHLIELCGLVRSIVVDPDGVYDPGLLNDRLLLGLKGTMSEFELNLLRQRCQEAIRQKAQRGELQFTLPVGPLGELQRLRLTVQVGLRDRGPQLGRAQLHVVARDFGGQRDLRRAELLEPGENAPCPEI